MKKIFITISWFVVPMMLLAGQPEYLQSTVADEIEQTFGVEIGPAGELYICSVGTHQIFKQAPNGTLDVVVGTGEKGFTREQTTARKATINEPYELRFDQAGNMYFVEMQNHVIRMVDTKGTLHLIAGTGTLGFAGDGGKGEQTQFNRPHSIALDEQGGWLYVADIGNHRIRRVHLTTREVETFAGTGKKQLPRDGSVVTGNPMLGPRALYIEGRNLWLALREGNSVWCIDLDTAKIRHIAGTGKKGFSGDGGNALAARLNGPKGIVANAAGEVFVVDTESQAIRFIDTQASMIYSIASPGTGAGMARPHGICLDAQGRVYVGDTNNHRVTRLEKKKANR